MIPVAGQTRYEITIAAMGGDHSAIVQLLALAQPDIRRFAIKKCKTSSDAEDAVQEALWQLYRRIKMLRTASALPAWLFTVVRRSCLRLARMATFGHVAWHELADDERLSARTTPELRLDVAAAIGSLPQHYREIVLLRDMEEMTIDEIGKTLGLSREAVKARLHRSRAMLREYLLK